MTTNYFFKLEITGASQAIEQALNTFDDRLTRDGSLRRGDTCFRVWKASKRNNDGTTTRYLSTYQAFAIDRLNNCGVDARITR